MSCVWPLWPYVHLLNLQFTPHSAGSQPRKWVFLVFLTLSQELPAFTFNWHHHWPTTDTLSNLLTNTIHKMPLKKSNNNCDLQDGLSFEGWGEKKFLWLPNALCCIKNNILPTSSESHTIWLAIASLSHFCISLFLSSTTGKHCSNKVVTKSNTVY